MGEVITAASPPMLPNKIAALLQLAPHFVAGLSRHEFCSDCSEQLTGELQSQIARFSEAASVLCTARNTATLSTKRLAIADKALKAWLAKARLVVMLARGARWSESWIHTGFTDGRTRVPTRLDARIGLARVLVGFFARHPEFGVGFAEVTAARGRAIYERVVQSCEMLRLAKIEWTAAREQHEAAGNDLREKLQQTISTLESHMTDDDPRWTDFGLIPPASHKSRARKSRCAVPTPILFVPQPDQAPHQVAAA